ncbi:hypothetical protein AURDEDRAFT_176049 [Auricularia subglabra TFB-10046 SS5]|uniref:VIT-domain-containing protein n=1 Tax=Auricularia subglabra (strain TFB-10046 / SS5) TaxID=717982 RepID=J0WS35_AURST|nr:hypothetical protein AURDEDRAFT_176049 [Auricularia subglabra TFB-10046 SS5]
MARPPHGLAFQSVDGATTFLPLIAVDVHATVVDTSAHVVVTQQFRQNGQSSDARYIFPTPASAAICAFRMETSAGRVVRARVKELSQAKDEYEKAVAKDRWAGLLQEVEPDAFVMSVGAIPAGEDVTVTVTFVQDLPQDDLASEIRFSFPTHIAERYGAVPTELQRGSSSPHSAILRIAVDIEMTSPIDRIWSPTHPITVRASSMSPSTFASVVEIDANSPISLNKDFVVSIRSADVAKPRCVAEVDERRNSVALSLTLVPHLGMETILEQEYIFLIDRSGSMLEDNRIEFAKSALQIFLRSLPAEHTLFNIVSFGSHCLPMWPTSRNYSPHMLDYATVQVDAMQADMGGTEIYSALLHAIQTRNTRIPASIFVLTDGKIWHTDRVLSFVRSQVQAAGPSNYIRVFSIGVGDGASTELCEGLARVGNGICFMASLAEDIAGRCAFLLKAARVQPSGNLNGLSVDWGSASSIQQAPSTIPDVFPDTRYVVSAILGGSTSAPHSVTLFGQTPSGTTITTSFPVHVLSQKARRTRLLHVLAARRLIMELDDQNSSILPLDNKSVYGQKTELGERIVYLSEEYQLASRYAAFVAVDVDDGDGTEDRDHDESDADDANEGGSESFQTPETLPSELEDEVNLGRSNRQSDGGLENDHPRPPGESQQHSSESLPQDSGQLLPNSESPTTTYTDADGSSTTYAILPSRSRNAFRSAAGAVMFVAGAFVHYVPAMEDFAEIITLSSGPARPIPLSQVFRRPPPRLSPPRQRLIQQRPAQSQEKVTQIARLQAHNGSFSLSPSLGALMARDPAPFLERCRAAKPQALADEDAWATILVLAFLRVRLAESRHVWEGLWTKAIEYASKCVSGGSLVIMQLVDQATALL